MSVAIVQIDAFTDRAFAGNPAAVCVLDSPAEESWMRNVAAEMNLSETAFAVPKGPGQFQLRWFTPINEVRLCGHATLATAHHLWESGIVPESQVASFETLSGVLTARKLDGGWIELDFPALPVSPAQALEPIARGVRVSYRYVGRALNGNELIEVESESVLRGLTPDLKILRALPMGLIVTAPGSGDFDFFSRFFAPGRGVDEDPVTGSAHCTLGPFWAARLGKSRLRAFQASRRGGSLRVEVQGDRVKLQGQAITVLRGSLINT